MTALNFGIRTIIISGIFPLSFSVTSKRWSAIAEFPLQSTPLICVSMSFAFFFFFLQQFYVRFFFKVQAFYLFNKFQNDFFQFMQKRNFLVYMTDLFSSTSKTTSDSAVPKMRLISLMLILSLRRIRICSKRFIAASSYNLYA